MRTFLTLAFFIAFSTAALAQDRIIVINPDGTVTEMERGASPVKPKETSPAPSRPAKAEPAPAAKPAKKPAAQKQAAPAEAPAKTKSADTAAPSKDKAPVKKPVAPKNKKPETSGKKKQAAPRATPQPAPDAAVISPRPSAAPTQVRLGPSMTPEDAIRIALDVAPPAISVNASPVNYKGLHAYEVVFKTEDGDRLVYVDRDTGRLVK